MSSLSNRSPSAADATMPSDEKPRLTDEEKKHNHIASEQKRRETIRAGFDRLTEIVPGMEGQGRSEGLVLQRTGSFIRKEMQRRQELIAQIEAMGGKVDDKYKKE